MATVTAMKEALVIILDISKSMGTRSADLLQQSKRSVELLIRGKIQTAPKDEVGVVLAGCKDTDNPMSEASPEEYRNIKVVGGGISTVKLDTYRQVDAFSAGDDGVAQCDLVDALVVGIAMIRDHCGLKKYKKRIVMVTDAGSPLRDDVPVGTIVQSLQQEDISFSVVGVAFNPNWDENYYDETSGGATIPISDAMDGGDVAMEGAENGEVADRKPRWTDKDRNEVMLHYITSKSGGSVAHLDEALSTLGVMRTRQVQQRSMFNGSLEISKHLQIAIQVYKKTDKTSLPSAKKKSKLAEQADDLKLRESADIIREDKFVSVDNLDDEDGITNEHRVKAYHYGKNLVPFNESDAAAMKFKADKCALVLGFVSMTQIKRHYFMDSALVFIPAPLDEHAQKAFSALVHALDETQRVILTRFVARSGSEPKIGFLWPHIRPHHEYLYYNQLPFTEDVRHYRFRSLESLTQLNDTQLNAAEDLINSMDLMNAEQDVDGEYVEALKPSETFHPIMQHLNNVLHNRALRPNDALPEIDPTIKKHCFPESHQESFYHKVIRPRAEKPLEKFLEQFPLNPLDQEKDGEKTKKKKKRFWFAMNNADGEELTLESYQSGQRKGQEEKNPDVEVAREDALVNLDAQQAVKRLKPNGEDDDNGVVGIDAIFTDRAESIGTTDPVKDFRDMLENRSLDLVDKAVEQLEQVIDRFVAQSIGDQYYQKALDCLVALREGCIKEEESAKFNNTIRKMKSAHGQKNSKRRVFWENHIVSRGVTLIHEDEAADSEITKQESDDFLQEDATAPMEEDQSLQAPPAEDDDLFGDLE